MRRSSKVVQPGLLGPTWARGYDVLALRNLAREVFGGTDTGMVRGAYSGVNEAQVAEWLGRGRLEHGMGWAVASRRLARGQVVRDFTGQDRLALAPGVRLVMRTGWSGPDGQDAVLRVLRAHVTLGPLAAWGWLEAGHAHRALYADAGLVLRATKVTAAGEVMGLWATDGAVAQAWPLDRVDAAGLCPVSVPGLPGEDAQRAVGAAVMDRVGAWARHYSTYNRGGGWHAVALCGFGGKADQVEKPSEMSKGWRAAHADRCLDVAADTPLRAALADLLDPLVALLPGKHERVRLMVLHPGSTIDRHAYITDPDRLGRYHVPLLSETTVTFTSWGLDGLPKVASMLPGTCWYLDTRKPHAVHHHGTAPRLHLVVYSTWLAPDLGA